MIDCIFTLDYEIYGNGEGSLKNLIYDPTERLLETFRKWDCRFVAFVEAAELEIIDAQGSDSGIDLVRRQIKELYKQSHEIALHLHPQWYNADYKHGRWNLDYTEYNLCNLSRDRIKYIVDRALSYLRTILDDPKFTPVSFRAGNWLFQPTHVAATVLAEHGIKVDSSVFKGGVQRKHRLDYRPSLKNGHYWRFQNDVNTPDPEGALLEMPIHSVMVPFWHMLTSKRVGIQRKVLSVASHGVGRRFDRLFDFLRPRYPLKLDFCRMTIQELISKVNCIINEDARSPALYRPLVAIGHTKDLVDFETIEKFLSFLQEKGIAVARLKDAYHKVQNMSASA